jgi:signal transduction histidine kinase
VLLSDQRLQQVLAGRELRFSRSIAGRSSNWRLLAVPVQTGGAPAALVLGRSLGSHDETLERLRDELLIAAPAALLLAILAGYWVAGAALRPVEAMRQRAAAISHETPGSRLPVPPARDELSRLAETLNEMLDRLEAAFEHERRFVSDASHELRTPLALLRTELELALRRPRSHDELEDTVRSAAEETERLSKLSSDLLLIARSDQGPLPLRREPVSGFELLSATQRRFAARAEQLGRAVVVAPGEDELLAVDRERVEQALSNLVDNALVHGSGTVELSLRAAGPDVELHVRDEGSGFPPDFASRAFDRFSRADEARGHGGSGLGLAIVSAIAIAHDGTAQVAGGNGRADVWLTLPGGIA